MIKAMVWSLRLPSRSVGTVGVSLAMMGLLGCSNAGERDDGGAAGASGGAATLGGGTGKGGSTAMAGGAGGTTSASGGAMATGGIIGAGGLVGVGGSTGAGGTLSTGGSAKTGGTSASGGVVGAGGFAGAGGALRTGGAPGTGGSGSNGGVPGSGGQASMGGALGDAGPASEAGGTACPPATPLTGGKQYCSNSKGSAGGNYSYELWASGSGSGCMTVYSVDAKFSATWTNVGDFLARIGLGFDQTKTPSQIGTISADFAETKTGDTGLVYVGIYGWTVSPLREYYILDDWGSTKPSDTASDGTPRTKVGTITVDGDTYDVWEHSQVNKPAITGNNQNFDQYFSVRQTARQCGHISISEHFSKWTDLGLQLGKLVEAKLLVEAQDSTGTIAFTTATVAVK